MAVDDHEDGVPLLPGDEPREGPAEQEDGVPLLPDDEPGEGPAGQTRTSDKRELFRSALLLFATNMLARLAEIPSYVWVWVWITVCIVLIAYHLRVERAKEDRKKNDETQETSDTASTALSQESPMFGLELVLYILFAVFIECCSVFIENTFFRRTGSGNNVDVR
ncbi:hypothetical protein [Rhizobium terrae]|uniref:hypothetical protein n=1 Tax=Rhizobium terrae TaxID=2171756 RepID=UPI000E3D7C02|nr:hypothetical protein [Rhizobium terrae]